MKTRTLPFILAVAVFSLFAANARAQAPAQFIVNVLDGLNQPITNAKVSLILRSGAYQNAALDGDKYTCATPGPCVRVYAAAPGHEAYSAKVANLSSGSINVKLTPSSTKNSTLIPKVGKLDGIDGEVKPLLDSQNRLYLWTDKIGLLDGNKPALQPIKFTIGNPITAETATGKRFTIWIKDITQQVSLVEYTMPQ